jgi:hypothetical protein
VSRPGLVVAGGSQLQSTCCMCRDLKLDNIVVRERVGCRPTYELADLGESKFAPAGAAVQHTAGVGALLYLAPEMRPVSAAVRLEMWVWFCRSIFLCVHVLRCVGLCMLHSLVFRSIQCT